MRKKLYPAFLGSLASLAVGLGLMGASSTAIAAYPDKPITLIVPFGAGSGTDTISRGLARGLSQKLGQSVVVANKAGAGGGIGTEYVARSAPDGYTFLMGTNGPMAANASLYSHLPYDPDKDFEAVALMGKLPMILIGSKTAPAKDLKALIAQAKAHPGTVNFGASNTTARVWVELLKKMADVQVVTVLYKDVGSMLTDLIGGRVSYSFENVGPSLSQIKAGKLNGIAVTGAQRASFAPEIPAMGEYGLDKYPLVVWYGMFAPKNTPKAIVDKVNAAANEVMHTEAMRELAKQVGMEPTYISADAFKKYQQDEIAKWHKLVDMTGVKIN